ncbi:lytic murein transglycosylase [Magnetovibrio blakemorei]|nr:lytic murein transglycosylase [Magnetovibrio blakemorei]
MSRLIFAFFAAVFILAAVPVYAEDQPAAEQSFADWLVELRAEARTKGISDKTLDAALTGLEPIPRVVELDRRQPEFTWTFRKYMDNLVNDKRIETGKLKLAENAKMLTEISEKYGVQPRFLIAFWGLETDFGRLAEGYFPTIAALATLAHDGRRSKFFRQQLFTALKIIDQGHISAERMKGSWAGAMGHFQFIPTTFDAYATDYDGDGKIDIWGNQGDAYASAANFLSKAGWKGDEIWGREVKLPKGFDFNLAVLKVRKTLPQWQALGVRRVDGSGLPIPSTGAEMTASIVAPAGAKGPAFLVYGNFRTIMVWNQSINYALAIGQLADRLVGLPAFSTLGPNSERGISHAEGIELQERLTALGFDTGGTDGVIGPNSREAVRKFQDAKGLEPDGYPSLELLESVRSGL